MYFSGIICDGATKKEYINMRCKENNKRFQHLFPNYLLKSKVCVYDVPFYNDTLNKVHSACHLIYINKAVM